MTAVSALYQRAKHDPRAFAAGYLEQLAALLATLDLASVTDVMARL